MSTAEKNSYLKLEDLETYKLSRELSRVAWETYSLLDWQQKKVIGDQFLTATDSCGANIAEGYGRFHYLDKAKFYYNARASLIESLHWFKLLTERKIVTDKKLIREYKDTYPILSLKLNAFIKATLKQKYS